MRLLTNSSKTPQISIVPWRDQRGNTLISSLVSLAIASITMFAIIQITVNSTQVSAQMDRSDNASESLIKVMLNLYTADFHDLVSYCSEKSALNRIRRGSCVANGQINTLGSTQVKDVAFDLEQPLDENGPTTSRYPSMCAELKSCTILAGGQMIEITVSQHWKVPGKINTIFEKQASLRKTRW